ncbi:MAG: Tim44/TimA family putative adaptor protein [Pseudomonadota bacterium]
MNPLFDPVTIIFLVVAIVVFLRLRSVLGRRTGNEPPPGSGYPSPAERSQQSNDNVVSLPPRGNGELEDEYDGVPAPTFPDGAVGEGLRQIYDVDPSFDPKTFIEGAQIAYEMIVQAFANGDRRSLRPLLARDVYDGFVSAIDARERADETMMSNLVSIDEAEITDAELRNKAAFVTVRFQSKIVSAVHGADGDVVSGDPNRVADVTDIWTFSRDTTSRDPNWKLVATEDSE